MKKFFLGLLSLFSFTANAIYFGDVKTISNTQLLKDREQYVVLDVRSNKEYAEGHIEGAINIPHTEVANHIARLKAESDKTIVVHCRSGYRAGKAEDVLMENGISNLLHLEGDMLKWQKDGLPLVTGKN